MSPRVLVTRPLPQAKHTAERLRVLGYTPILAPMLRVERLPVPDGLELDTAQAIVATSRNGVEAFASITVRRDHPVFVVGDRTAEAARQLGFRDVVSADGDAKALAALIDRHILPARGPILHARGKDVVVPLSTLLDPAIECREAILYHAVPTPDLPLDAQDFVPDAALVYSPRTGKALADALRISEGQFSEMTVIGISHAALVPLESLNLASLIAADAPNEDAIFSALRGAVEPAEKN